MTLSLKGFFGDGAPQDNSLESSLSICNVLIFPLLMKQIKRMLYTAVRFSLTSRLAVVAPVSFF